LCRELFISELTLKTHRRNIHRKMKYHALAMRRRETPG
jgi:DNA-binding CsgD family transcriptional regulator